MISLAKVDGFSIKVRDDSETGHPTRKAKVLVMEGNTVLTDSFHNTPDGIAAACLFIAESAIDARPEHVKHLTFASRLFAMESRVRARRDKLLRRLVTQLEQSRPDLK